MAAVAPGKKGVKDDNPIGGMMPIPGAMGPCQGDSTIGGTADAGKGSNTRWSSGPSGAVGSIFGRWRNKDGRRSCVEAYGWWNAVVRTEANFGEGELGCAEECGRRGVA